jgi:hypothetical protein
MHGGCLRLLVMLRNPTTQLAVLFKRCFGCVEDTRLKLVRYFFMGRHRQVCRDWANCHTVWQQVMLSNPPSICYGWITVSAFPLNVESLYCMSGGWIVTMTVVLFGALYMHGDRRYKAYHSCG